MTINGINGVSSPMGQMGMNQVTDAYSRNIQNQIAEAQKQLQEISSNEDMTLEEKMKKRQEIQQQISNLNIQLKQHQIEQRRAAQSGSEKPQVKRASDEMLGGTGKAESKSAGLSQASMTAMISAESSIKQAKVQGSVAKGMQGKAGVLESEIKLDKVRGNDTQAKEEELAKIEQKAQAATTSQLSTLADAGKTMEEAAKADNKTKKADDKTENTDRKNIGVKGKDAEENISGTDAQGKNVSNVESVSAQSDNSASGSTQAVDAATTPQPTVYTPVDIRL